MIFSYILLAHSHDSHAGHPLQTKIMMTQTKYDDRHLILVTLVTLVTLATVFTLVIRVAQIVASWHPGCEKLERE